MVKQIFVVEGKNDVIRLKQVFPTIMIVSVNGSAINDDIVQMLISKKDEYEIVVCTDPDYPGLRIRSELEEKIGKISHVFLDRHKSYSKNKKKIGLEHLSNYEIRKAFSQIIKSVDESTSDVDLDFLYEHKLVGNQDSKKIREDLSLKMNLGYVNGKTLLNRIRSFNIMKEDIVNNLK